MLCLITINFRTNCFSIHFCVLNIFVRQRLDYVQNFHLKVEMRWWSKEEGESGSEGRDRERVVGSGLRINGDV